MADTSVLGTLSLRYSPKFLRRCCSQTYQLMRRMYVRRRCLRYWSATRVTLGILFLMSVGTNDGCMRSPCLLLSMPVKSRGSRITRIKLVSGNARQLFSMKYWTSCELGVFADKVIMSQSKWQFWDTFWNVSHNFRKCVTQKCTLCHDG